MRSQNDRRQLAAASVLIVTWINSQVKVAAVSRGSTCRGHIWTAVAACSNSSQSKQQGSGSCSSQSKQSGSNFRHAQSQSRLAGKQAMELDCSGAVRSRCGAGASCLAAALLVAVSIAGMLQTPSRCYNCRRVAASPRIPPRRNHRASLHPLCRPLSLLFGATAAGLATCLQ